MNIGVLRLCILRQTKHNRSTSVAGNESTKVTASFLDFLDVLCVDNYSWRRHEFNYFTLSNNNTTVQGRETIMENKGLVMDLYLEALSKPL